MLSISPPMKGAGKGDYYLGLAQEDYYTKGGEPPGEWYGEGAEDLQLNGRVQDQDLRDLLEGYSPGRKRALVQNAGEVDRQSGWDLTFSAPKSASNLWAVGDDEIKQIIQDCHKKGVHAALDYLQDEAAFTRRGKGGTETESTKLVFATFDHGTSRALEPQIHTHALLLNAGVREDGTTGSVLSQPIFEEKMAAGAIYRAEFAHQLEVELNLKCIRDKSCFRIEGSPKPLEEEFSTRRKEIEEALKESGYSGAKASKIAALNTRTAKEHLPREFLFKEWEKTGALHNFGPENVRALTQGKRIIRDPEKELSEALSTSVNNITDKHSYFHRGTFIRHVAEEAQGRGLSASEVRNGVEVYLKNSPEIIHLGEKCGKQYFTTVEILELERGIIETVRARAKEVRTIPDSNLYAALNERPKLDDEQKNAIKRITQGNGATQIVTGFAGTGKSYMLQAARDAFEQSCFKVYGAAPSGKAAQELEEGSGIKSNTIHKTLSDIEKGDLLLDKTSVLVIDEAGMVSTKLMSRVVQVTDEAGAKLILTGDERQIQSVQAGGALRTLKEEIGFSELTEIPRQRDDWAKEAVKAFAQGDADKALSAYNARGLVTVTEDPEAAREKLISDWKEKGISDPENNIIIATTNLDVSILNEKAQAARRSNGQLKGEGITHAGRNYFRCDRVLMTRNSLRYGVKNGSLGTITDLSLEAKTIKVTLDTGKDVTLPLNMYEHINLGYTVTAHKSQGSTFENAHLFVNGQDNKEIAYVKASRVKNNAHFYMDKETAGEDLTSASKQMERSSMKELATRFRKTLNQSNDYSRGRAIGE